MKYLLDVNALLALAHQDHADHEKTSIWYKETAGAASAFLTCPITELGFLRVSMQAGLSRNLDAAQDTLSGMKKSSRVPFAFVPDSVAVDKLPSYVRTPAQLTDGYLLQLAKANGAKLATLDAGIPGALRIG
ncbi:MAG: PIN domain-containing protein [Chthoniobacterales bacterium]